MNSYLIIIAAFLVLIGTSLCDDGMPYEENKQDGMGTAEYKPWEVDRSYKTDYSYYASAASSQVWGVPLLLASALFVRAMRQ